MTPSGTKTVEHPRLSAAESAASWPKKQKMLLRKVRDAQSTPNVQQAGGGSSEEPQALPFYSMYLLDKDIKLLELQDDIEAKDELKAKTAELNAETNRLHKAVMGGVIQPPVEDAELSPENDSGSARDSISSDGTFEKTTESNRAEGDTQ